MEEEQPVYVVTETGLELQKKTPEAAPVEKSRYLLGSPFLTFSLFLALTAYFLDAGEWMKAAERYVASKNRSAAAQPYRDWARLHPMDYDEVAAVPDIWTGKAVLWYIVRSPAGKYYCGGDGMKPLAWVEESEVRQSMEPGTSVEILARVEGDRDHMPLLMFLEGP